MWALSSLKQQLRTFSHKGSYRAMQEGSLRPVCTLPLQSPSANNSQCTFDSNPNQSHQQGLKDPATAVHGSWWWLSSAVPGDLETQWLAKHVEITADFQQHSSKIGIPKASTPRHQTGIALAEKGLGNRGTTRGALERFGSGKSLLAAWTSRGLFSPCQLSLLAHMAPPEGSECVLSMSRFTSFAFIL